MLPIQSISPDNYYQQQAERYQYIIPNSQRGILCPTPAPDPREDGCLILNEFIIQN